MSLWVSWHISKMTLFPNDQALLTVNLQLLTCCSKSSKTTNLVKFYQPYLGPPTLSGYTYLVKLKAGWRTPQAGDRTFPPKISSSTPRFCRRFVLKIAQAWIFCFSNNYCFNKQQFYIRTWLPQLLPQDNWWFYLAANPLRSLHIAPAVPVIVIVKRS